MKKRLLPVSILSLVAAAVIAAGTGCRDSNSITGPPLTPTAAPAANVTGVWTGDFTQTLNKFCADGAGTAVFEQNGSSVTGTLTATGDCGFSAVPFRGTMRGNSLTGRAQGSVGDFTFDTAVVLIIDANHLRIDLRDSTRGSRHIGTLTLTS